VFIWGVFMQPLTCGRGHEAARHAVPPGGSGNMREFESQVFQYRRRGALLFRQIDS
jgi:hypothetical protein